jgi:hypothetical protein
MFGFFCKFNHLLVDDEVDEDIHEYDVVQLAFHHVVTFVVTLELLFSNCDDLTDDNYRYSRLVMITNRHYKLD